MAAIPWAMVWLRVALCPVILLGAQRGWAGAWLGAFVLFALVDDIFDGILARRWGCDTPTLCLADSAADTIFYLGVAGALWLRESHWKFGKAASYHSYLDKTWGLVMNDVKTLSAARTLRRQMLRCPG